MRTRNSSYERAKEQYRDQEPMSPPIRKQQVSAREALSYVVQKKKQAKAQAASRARAATRIRLRLLKQEGVVKQSIGPKSVPYIVTHDARTIRYPDPHLKVDDTMVIDIETGKITDYVKFDSGNLCMITGGRDMGRVGIVGHRERHPGSFDIVLIKDAAGHTFVTRLNNVFIVGRGSAALVSLPADKGTKLHIAEERDKRPAQKQKGL